MGLFSEQLSVSPVLHREVPCAGSPRCGASPVRGFPPSQGTGVQLAPIGVAVPQA
jgi:hypothetical protein